MIKCYPTGWKAKRRSLQCDMLSQPLLRHMASMNIDLGLGLKSVSLDLLLCGHKFAREAKRGAAVDLNMISSYSSKRNKRQVQKNADFDRRTLKQCAYFSAVGVTPVFFKQHDRL